MGCGKSKHKRKVTETNVTIQKAETGGTKTQQVLNSWEQTPPVPAPYPQGKTDVNRILETELSHAGTVYDPNPEIVGEREAEGELVPSQAFFSIVPVEPISPGVTGGKKNVNLLDWSDDRVREMEAKEEKEIGVVVKEKVKEVEKVGGVGRGDKVERVEKVEKKEVVAV